MAITTAEMDGDRVRDEKTEKDVSLSTRSDLPLRGVGGLRLY